MARTTGSDELFKLIHSLTTSEKGYFQKYAKRHSGSKTDYLKLFDAIAKQPAFEEKALVKKFKSFPLVKAYLKEMLTDSLLLYYRKQHPHIGLLSEIQKVHVLLMKGMQDEALKILDKAIKEAKKMEQFALCQYMMRMRNNVLAITSNPPSITEMKETYSKDMKQLQTAEDDLLQWELKSLSVSGFLKQVDTFSPGFVADEINEVKQVATITKRSKLLKLESLYSLYRAEMNEKELLGAAKNFTDSAEDFKRNFDSSFDDVPALSNYITTLSSYGKTAEVLEEYDRIFSQPRYDQQQFNLLFVRCFLIKIAVTLHLGQFEETLECLIENEKNFMAAVNFTNDSAKKKTFNGRKAILLFLNKQYQKTWLLLQDIDLKEVFSLLKIDYADFKMLEIMTQYMLGNFDLVKSMAKKCKKAFADNEIESVTYQKLLDFFIFTSPGNYVSEAKNVSQAINDYYTTNKKFPRKAFAQMRYTFWLDEIAGKKTIRYALHEQYGGKLV